MRIAIIDADLIGATKHRFPNLACMKLSSYHKSLGHTVELKTEYKNLAHYDKVYISKVFTATPISEDILEMPNVEYGGTGFFYADAPPLPYKIEHCFPDYSLYKSWVDGQIQLGKPKKDFIYYIEYSIGFTTRGCFRKCSFCVNQKYDKVHKHSALQEFVDKSRKYICLLDDNIFGYSGWREVFQELISYNKPFQYKQGMDERLMTEEKAKLLDSCKYKGDIIFAFDNIEDREIIEKKLTLWRKICKKRTKLYVFCAFDRKGVYDDEFWKQDIADTFERIKILMKYDCLPYIMRFDRYEESPYRGTYINLASWCNQPGIFRNMSYREFCIRKSGSSGEKAAPYRYMNKFLEDAPNIADKYYDIKFKEVRE